MPRRKTTKIQQAYKQAPWRKEIRWIAGLLLFLVLFVLVAISNLRISADTYSVGVEIQGLELERENLIRQIADLRNSLAARNSTQEMNERAEQMGYNKINDPEDMVYLVVPGYQQESIDLHLQKPASPGINSIILPEYTKSLWELFFEGGLKLDKMTERPE